MKYRVVIPDKHLKRQVFRCGGPGGQSVNKTESGVRYIHIPSGVAAEARSERSQHKNDAIALESLYEKLIRLWLIQRGKSLKGVWERKPDVAFGAKMRSYILAGQRRVIDHETEWEGEPRAVLSGDIDDLLKTRLQAALMEEWA